MANAQPLPTGRWSVNGNGFTGNLVMNPTDPSVKLDDCTCAETGLFD